MKKILLLGSGALKIGQAGEFDYSGSQAIKAFKEEGIKTVLINPNIATIQTSKELADKVYFLPVTPFFVEQVINKEKPDGVVLSFGGQTALNCGIDLYKKGVFDKYRVQVLGTSVDTIIKSEDRKKFADHLKKIGVTIPKSIAISTVDQGLKAIEKIGFPLMIRSGYALGGLGSGVIKNKKEFVEKIKKALSFSPQVLIEQYLHHFKEIEYEIVRDQYDNCVAVCNMENFDPLSIHTGDSIVVAPSQTLTNFEYHYLREIAIKIVRSLNIIGECNVQFALNPKPKNSRKKSLDYYVIEVNPRLSRSSALASKATGYPLAYVAAKLILGKSLTSIKNQVTKATQAAFEPALDYLVVKIPRWDIEKFQGAEETIGSSMKSVGEVMAIGRSFEEAIQKAIRMLEIGASGVMENRFSNKKDILRHLKTPTPRRLFALTAAIKNGIALDKIYNLTGIDKWFLFRLKNIVDSYSIILPEIKDFFKSNRSNQKEKNHLKEKILILKKLGFSDKQIAQDLKIKEEEFRQTRKKLGIKPYVFSIDTLAGEYPAKTNYLYLTYWGSHDDVKLIGNNGIIVLGSGPYRIGSSVEFDWNSVNVALRLKKYGKKSVIINCNPETVSTDYDMSDRLYFEELTFERIADILDFEKPFGIILSVGGQTPNNLSQKLTQYGANILGTKADSINLAENRNKFSQLLDKLKILQPQWKDLTDVNSVLEFAKKVGYPVLVRPSYVLSGQAMNLCYSENDLKRFIKKTAEINKEHPVTISKFINNAREIEFDAVAEDGEIMIFAIANHIEHAGVHSGDATIVYPAERVRYFTGVKIVEVGKKLVKSLKINGPFNIQFVAKDNQVYVIELNLRASRTFPFISKATGVNFAHLIVDVIFKNGKKYVLNSPDYVVVKAPQFSFARLEGADPVLRVEMASTGEVGCFGETVEEAYLKSLLSTGFSLDKKSVLITVGGEENKLKFAQSVWRLKNLGFKIYATKNTHNFLKEKGVKTILVKKVYEGGHPNVLDIINQKKVSLVINISEKGDGNPVATEKKTDGYLIRRAAVDNNISLITDINSARLLVKALDKYKIEDLKVKSWKEYFR